jgi:hypothetical protein
MHVFKGYMYHGYISTGALLKVASAMLGDVTSVGICSEIPNKQSQSVFLTVKTIMKAAQNPTTRPPLVGDSLEYYLFWF